MTLNGVDLSNNNAWVDWSGVDFAFYKATEGATFVDYTQTSWAKHIVPDGPYHFAHPDVNSPDTEAANFLMHAIPGKFWGLDCETRTVNGHTYDPLAIMGPDALGKWCDRFYDLVIPKVGPNAYHYTFRSYATQLWPKLVRPWRWWLASAYGQPHYQSFAGKTVDIEQYTIVNGVDRNVSYTPIQLGPQTGTDMPLTEADLLEVTAAAENAQRVMWGVPLDASPQAFQEIVVAAITGNVVDSLLAKLPASSPTLAPAPAPAIDTDALAAKVADLLAQRLQS